MISSFSYGLHIHTFTHLLTVEPFRMNDTELLLLLLNQVELIISKDSFHKLYGFILEDYLSNRRIFSKICRDHADHVEQFVKVSGMARTVGGSVTIVAGGIAILGIILAPFTAAASLGLTIGGVTGGILGAGTSVTAGMVKHISIRSDKRKIKEALKKFDAQEKVISVLLTGVHDNLNLLTDLKKRGVTKSKAGIAFKGLTGAGSVVMDGVRLAKAVNGTVTFGKSAKLATFANNVSTFIRADVAAATNLAEGAAAPGLFGKAVVVAGTTTAKVFSGVFAAFGIGLGIWDIVKGVKDIKGSKIALAFREFADEYDKDTEKLLIGIEQLPKLIHHDCAP